MKTLAIIIAAYDCAEYIIDCLQSLVGTRQPLLEKGWDFDLRLGIDGCERTAKVLQENDISFYWSEKNVGAYVMRNSLIYLDKADAYGYFDSDDIMMPLYMFYVSKFFQDNVGHAIMLGKTQVDQNLNMCKKQNIIDDGGAISFDQYALDKVGGFQPYRCAADTDFMRRLNMAGIEICTVNVPFYYRRNHNNSLTRSGLTKFGGDYRKQVWKEMCDQRAKGVIKIEPEIVKLEKIG